MADPLPVVCVFFKLPPSDQLFLRIHDLAWHVLLPQLEKLTYALEALLVTNPSPTAMKTLVQAREAMGDKMLPVRDAVMSSQGFAILYIQFIDEATDGDNLTPFVKEIQTFSVEDTIATIEKAQRAVFEFREELETVVRRITSSVGGDNDHLSLFIAESSQIISVMISAVEECVTLFQESSECFENIHKQSFDLESFKRNPPSSSEFQLAREKWELLRSSLQDKIVDWVLLRSRMVNPALNRALNKKETPEVRDTTALAGIPEDPVDPESGTPPELSPPKQVKIPFWRKVFQRVSSCISSRPFC